MAKKVEEPIINQDEVTEDQAASAELEQTAEAESVVEAKDETEKEDNTKSTTKAGKRSKKALDEAEAGQAKEDRKKSSDSASKPKANAKPVRSRAERKGKKYREAASHIEKDKSYHLMEALALAQKTSAVKFDASVELHINLNVDPRQADQNVRGNLVLPHGTGKTIRVAVFDDAKVEGADISGVETITKALEKGEIKFDVLISSPANMANLGKYARLLGPRGLMPSPKSGTVAADVAKAVKDAKAGKIDYRVDSTGIVHTAIGKVSFKPEQLVANAEALLASVQSAKPSSLKGNYVKAIHTSSSMGPSIKIES